MFDLFSSWRGKRFDSLSSQWRCRSTQPCPSLFLAGMWDVEAPLCVINNNNNTKNTRVFLFLTQNTHFYLKISTIANRENTKTNFDTTISHYDFTFDRYVDGWIFECVRALAVWPCKEMQNALQNLFHEKILAEMRTTNFFLVVSLAVFLPENNEEQFHEPKCRKSGDLLQLTTTVVGKVKFLYSPAAKYRIYSRYSSRAVATYHAECHDVKHELPTQRWLPWRQRIFVFILPWVSILRAKFLRVFYAHCYFSPVHIRVQVTLSQHDICLYSKVGRFLFYEYPENILWGVTCYLKISFIIPKCWV